MRVCVCDIMYVYVQVWVHMYLNASGGQRLTLTVFFVRRLTSCFWDRASQWTWDSLVQLDSASFTSVLASQWTWDSLVQLDAASFRSVLAPSSLLFSSTEVTDVSTACSFYIGVEGLNSGPCEYLASSLPAEPSPQLYLKFASLSGT